MSQDQDSHHARCRFQGKPAAKVAKGKGDAKVGVDADGDGRVSVSGLDPQPSTLRVPRQWSRLFCLYLSVQMDPALAERHRISAPFTMPCRQGKPREREVKSDQACDAKWCPVPPQESRGAAAEAMLSV